MILRQFEYVECKRVDDAVAALARTADDARVIAGGTALVPLMKHQVLRPAVLVSIVRVPGLADIVDDEGGGLRVGGAATHWDVSRSPLVRERSPLLAYACGRVASPTIRSMGTLGGNLCYGESASDPSPALLALRARVRLRGPEGERAVPLEKFFTGFYETALAPAEILTTVEVPPMPAGARLDPLQDAFVRHGAIQCGFWTPGVILVTTALLAENPRPSDEEIREFLSGNFCRCAGYSLILNAVREAAGRPAREMT